MMELSHPIGSSRRAMVDSIIRFVGVEV